MSFSLKESSSIFNVFNEKCFAKKKFSKAADPLSNKTAHLS